MKKIVVFCRKERESGFLGICEYIIRQLARHMAQKLKNVVNHMRFSVPP